MAPVLVTPRPQRPRRPTRPKSAGPIQPEQSSRPNISSEPPRKKLRYIPGGPGGGGRYVDDNGTEIPVGGTGPGGYNYIGPRGRVGRENLANGVQPVIYPRRDRSTRTRTVLPRSQQPPMRFQSAAQAAAVVQSDGYKPREERAWEEFHPNLDIEAPLRAFGSDDVEGSKSKPATPAGLPQSADGSVNGGQTPNGIDASATKGEGIITPAASLNGEPLLTISIPGTPGGGKRRPGRPPKDPVAFFTKRAAQLGKSLNIGTLKAPKVITPTIQNTSTKEKLTLPQPSYRRTDTLSRFEDKALGLVRYVDKSMANVGYQESDIFVRSEFHLIKNDPNVEEDLDLALGHKGDSDGIITIGSGGVGRVEYDMDEQDDKWLEAHNAERKATGFEPITREIFEITITKIEKEWHALEKRIPKPNPKPPQTHRPRSSSAAAVNGEPQPGEEQDSKCAICDDGDCENTNAIVFCDGCDLAVHQECYGVPFIPEGQWLCRKCQLIGRGIPTCIFCPNTDGAFKQTNASKWAHLLCAMWIPEVSLGNHTFMEPVMEVEKVPKTRWKLTCYLCNQKMGACIQCGNKACYQAFHVTCARKARLFLKMKNSHGTLAVLDGSTVLKAFCDKHCPLDYSKENDVARATREARIFYKKTMRGRLWADSQASALAMAATHRHAVTEHPPDESQLTGERVAQTMGESKKKGNQPQRPIWKLPSGAPVIPQVVFTSVESSLQRFGFRKRKEYAADACRYWTLKREARRGAALLKRLQLQMETFSSMEITRRNFAGMGPAGRGRLDRRVEFAKTLIEDLERLKALADEIKAREDLKLQKALQEEAIVNTVYFPVAKLLPEVIDKVLDADKKNVFTQGLSKLGGKVRNRFYTTALTFVNDLSMVFSAGISNEPPVKSEVNEADKTSPSKKHPIDMRERKRLAKRIIKAVQPQLELAVQVEADISGQPTDALLNELHRLIEASFQSPMEPGGLTESNSLVDAGADEGMADLRQDGVQTLVLDTSEPRHENHDPKESIDVEMEDADAPHEEVFDAVVVDDGSSKDAVTNTAAALSEVNGNISPMKYNHINGTKGETISPITNGYVTVVETNQPGPPTPPFSNGDVSSEQGVKVLTDGGIPRFLFKDFRIDGTNISGSEPTAASDDLSDMDDDELNALRTGLNEADEEVIAVGVRASPVKTKKGKAKKRKAGSRR